MITRNVELSPGPLKSKRHKSSLHSCITGRSRTRASKIKCKVEESPGPLKGPHTITGTGIRLNGFEPRLAKYLVGRCIASELRFYQKEIEMHGLAVFFCKIYFIFLNFNTHLSQLRFIQQLFIINLFFLQIPLVHNVNVNTEGEARIDCTDMVRNCYIQFFFTCFLLPTVLFSKEPLVLRISQLT